MAITISRTGELNPRMDPVTQEQREALWAAFVTNWLDNHQDDFTRMVAEPEQKSA